MKDINWASTDNNIAYLKKQTDDNRLELQPSFQRKSVWGKAARIMLMDTILKNIPMPKIFVSSIIKGDTPYLSVIDGQQRIRAILSFIKGEFSLQRPYVGEYKDKKFDELPEATRAKFLRYNLNFNEITDASNEQLREIYSRVNKYSSILNKQELRRADFPGDFLELAEKLSVNPFFDNTRIFTITSRRRFNDAEYVSELLAGLIDGIQDKKKTLDDFYKDYVEWDKSDKEKIEERFNNILKDIALIFNGKEYSGDSGPKTISYHEELKFNGLIGKTRFKQKADFYALFFAISDLKKQELSIKGKNLDNLRLDLALMDKYTEPHSEINLFREYATKCLSDANSKASRKWRVDFLLNILSGSYCDNISIESNKLFSSISLDWIGILTNKANVFEGSPSFFHCGKCQTENDLINCYEHEDHACSQEEYLINKGAFLYWDRDEPNHQLVNSKFICCSCSNDVQI